MRILVWIMRFAILLALVWFSVKNAEVVTLHAYPWSWQAPLVVVILVFFAAGVMLGLLACVSSLWKLKREVKSLNKALKARDNAVATQVATGTSQSSGVGPHGV